MLNVFDVVEKWINICFDEQMMLSVMIIDIEEILIPKYYYRHITNY